MQKHAAGEERACLPFFNGLSRRMAYEKTSQ